MKPKHLATLRIPGLLMIITLYMLLWAQGARDTWDFLAGGGQLP